MNYNLSQWNEIAECGRACAMCVCARDKCCDSLTELFYLINYLFVFFHTFEWCDGVNIDFSLELNVGRGIEAMVMVHGDIDANAYGMEAYRGSIHMVYNPTNPHTLATASNKRLDGIAKTH